MKASTDYDYTDDQIGIQLFNYVNSWNRYVLIYKSSRLDNFQKNLDDFKFDIREIACTYHLPVRLEFESGFAVLYIADQRIHSELDILAQPSRHEIKKLAEIVSEIKDPEWKEFAVFLEGISYE